MSYNISVFYYQSMTNKIFKAVYRGFPNMNLKRGYKVTLACPVGFTFDTQRSRNGAGKRIQRGTRLAVKV